MSLYHYLKAADKQLPGKHAVSITEASASFVITRCSGKAKECLHRNVIFAETYVDYTTVGWIDEISDALIINFTLAKIIVVISRSMCELRAEL